MADCIDPLGGSYYVEHLTDAIEEKAAGYIRKIDDLGGALRAIEQGFQQREIQESSYRTQKDIEAVKLTFVSAADSGPTEPIEVLSGPDGELYTAGSGFKVAKSTTMQDSSLPAQWDFSTMVSLDGDHHRPHLFQVPGRIPTPDGLLVGVPMEEDGLASHLQFGQGLPQVLSVLGEVGKKSTP